jgi:putative restriction endonuclease
MAGRDWSEVVEEAVRRHLASTGDPVFTRQDLIDAELNRMVSETGSTGETPHMTLSRELQQLRDAGVLEFVDDRGTYRLIG